MAGVFDVLGHDHEEVKRMLAELESGPSATTGADEVQLRARKKAVERLIIIQSAHETVEEEYFWPAVREKLAFPEGVQLADEAVGQEQAGKFVLDRLGKLRASDREFERLLGRFIVTARAHIAFEETRVWPVLWQAFSAAESSRLASKLARARERAPTRPHPKTPPLPSILKVTGPAAAAVDRLRDALTGRGRGLAGRREAAGGAAATGERRHVRPAGTLLPVNRAAGACDSRDAIAAIITLSSEGGCSE
jgi:hypothetical protein